MGFSLVAQRRCGSIYDIDGKALRAQGITLLLADLDNTLATYQAREPDEALRRWTEGLQQEGVALFILSNSRKTNRVEPFAEALGVPYLRRAGKPRPDGFFRAMEQMGRTPAQTAMVGDQIITDILGANRAGIPVILVQPVRLDNWFRRIRYMIETPFRLCAPKEKQV